MSSTEIESVDPKNIFRAFRATAVILLLYALFNLIYDPTTVFFDRNEKPDLDLVNAGWMQVREVLDHPKECNSFILATSRGYVWDAGKLGGGWCKIVLVNVGINSYAHTLQLLVRGGVKIKQVILLPEYWQYFNVSRYSYYATEYNILDYPITVPEKVYALYRLLFLPPTIKEVSYFMHRLSGHPMGQRLSWDAVIHKPSLQWFPIFSQKPEARADWLNHQTATRTILEEGHYEPEGADSALKEIFDMGKTYGFRVICVIAPESIKNIVASNKNDRFDIYRRLARIAPFYDFSDHIDISVDINQWFDPTHYNVQIADKMINDIRRGGNGMTFGKLITTENVDTEIHDIQTEVYNQFIGRLPYPPNTLIDNSWLGPGAANSGTKH